MSTELNILTGGEPFNGADVINLGSSNVAGETLDEAREEIERKVNGILPEVRVDTIWGR